MIIIILAVLTGVAVPSYLVFRNKAKIQATRIVMLDIATAISIYEADRNSFPVALSISAMAIALESTDTSGDDVYLESCPTEDAWEGEYSYKGTEGTYSLKSTAGTSYNTSDDIILTDGKFTTETKSILYEKKRKGRRRHR